MLKLKKLYSLINRNATIKLVNENVQTFISAEQLKIFLTNMIYGK